MGVPLVLRYTIALKIIKLCLQQLVASMVQSFLGQRYTAGQNNPVYVNYKSKLEFFITTVTYHFSVVSIKSV